MQDMDKDTVDFVPNYDERLTEPTVFPAAFPNLLVNGGTGIAVGMATNMPPHNLGEVIDGICAQIDKPEITIPELMKFIKGPDFPTGGIICGIEGIKNYFTTGAAASRCAARSASRNSRATASSSSSPRFPTTSTAPRSKNRSPNLVNEKIITEISAMRNESDEHCRLVIELKRDAIPRSSSTISIKHTQLEVSFSVNALAIDHGGPRRSISRSSSLLHRAPPRSHLRRTRFELRKAEERAELLEGYLIALSNLDEFIRIIRNSQTAMKRG
jgi:DNA gyrase subunit A